MELPSRFRITREIKGNPLKNIPMLAMCPPPFQPTGHYTEEWKEIINRGNKGDFLLPEEHTLMHHFMSVQNAGFAWSDQEGGHFCEDFFAPIEIPMIPHKLWAQSNIPIPLGIYVDVYWIIHLNM